MSEKLSSYQKSIQIQCTPHQYSKTNRHRFWKDNFQLHMESCCKAKQQQNRIAETILNNRIVGVITIANVKLYCRPIVVNIAWHGHRNRQIYQWNWDSDIKPHIYEHQKLGTRDNQMRGEKGWKRRSGWSERTEGEKRHRQQQEVYTDPEMRLKGRRGGRAEDFHLLYLHPWLVRLVGSQGEPAVVENWEVLVSVGNEGWREKISVTHWGWWQVTWGRCSAVGLDMKLGDCVWRNVGRRDLKLVYPLSLLILHFISYGFFTAEIMLLSWIRKWMCWKNC